MFIMNKKPGDKIIIDHNIEITFLKSNTDETRIAVKSPDDSRVISEEELINNPEQNGAGNIGQCELFDYGDKHGE